MTIRVQFYSYFKELAGSPGAELDLPEGGSIDQLLDAVYARFPKLGTLRNATLIAVGVDYQPKSHLLNDGDEVSLFPPVQGG
jgi:molybdopterin converting factor small subunit